MVIKALIIMYIKLVKYIYCKYLIQKIGVQIDYEQYTKPFEIGFLLLSGLCFVCFPNLSPCRPQHPQCLPSNSFHLSQAWELKGQRVQLPFRRMQRKSFQYCSKPHSAGMGSGDKFLHLDSIPLIPQTGHLHGLITSLSPDFNIHVYICVRP